MMPHLGVVSYATAAGAFLLLALLLITSWRGRLQGALLVAATVASVAWAALAAFHAWGGASLLRPVLVAESLRDLLWSVFLLRLLPGEGRRVWRRLSGALVFALFAVTAWAAVFQAVPVSSAARTHSSDLFIFGMLLYAVIGLALVEQLYRNTRPERRWTIKFLCFGLGGLFAYDFFLYSEALLFERLDPALWSARGVIDAVTVPLIAVAAARNPHWSVDIFVSRRMVFHTTAVLGAGVYLLVMAAGGYYIRYYGGDWGVVAQAVFLFGAVMVLLVVLFSDQVRARIKVFINKHFYSYKYDYREEWLRFIRTLSTAGPGPQLREQSIRALSNIVDSNGGALWLGDAAGRLYESAAVMGLPEDQHLDSISVDDPLARFLGERRWVIDLQEFRSAPQRYPGLKLPAWLDQAPWAWLVVPLVHHEHLFGIMVLKKSRAPRRINWEDCDLLKTAAYQAAAHLAQAQAAQALMDARQFETFNRLSAFIIHDLKSLVSQLSLLLENAGRHKDNPAFIEDMIATVGDSVTRMNRLLAQLRKKGPATGPAPVFDLADLLREAVRMKSGGRPVPRIGALDQGLRLAADRERLGMVLAHLIQNAQDATPPEGDVEVSGRRRGDEAIIEIRDSGCGMDARFLRDRLFRPFDTTKGERGMGIGVYEAREFVRALGGDVEVVSAPGAGTTFTLRLPLINDRSAAPDRVPTPQERSLE